MSPLIVQSQWKGFRISSLTPDHILDVQPTDEYPRGQEAALLAILWSKLRMQDIPGLLLLGCDVAADPDDYEAMSSAVFLQPHDVHTGMVKLWPASTGRPDWMWSHRGGTVGNPVAGQHDVIHIAYFSLGFVFVPRRLLDRAFPAHANWKWGEMDVGLSEIAGRNHIRIHAVPDCTPKHLHFTESHNR